MKLWTHLMGAAVCGLLFTCPAPARADQGYLVVGPEGHATLRWLTTAALCPSVRWASGHTESLKLRAAPETVQRAGDDPDNSTAVFAVRVCETAWPRAEAKASIEGQAFATPYHRYRRIAIIGDTGCRQKASSKAYQNCESEREWPFEKVSRKLAAMHPDLVVHVGDIHYRESPCPKDRPCRNDVWGYGSDAWDADFFHPAHDLLQAAPWVFVRGNHESCERAGQGWFRFIDPRPWDERYSCKLAADDVYGNFTSPYAVPIHDGLQLLIMDSAASAGQPLAVGSATFQQYRRQWSDILAIAARKAQTLFLSHHPLLAVAPNMTPRGPTPGGSEALWSVFDDALGSSGFPPHLDWLIHGHIHTFEAMDFIEDAPGSLVLGNSGSQRDGELPLPVTQGTQLHPGLHVRSFLGRHAFGFAVLDVSPSTKRLHLTEYDADGQVKFLCDMQARRLSCQSR